MYKSLLAFLLIPGFLLTSCDTGSTNKETLDAYAPAATTTISPDSLLQSWNDAWNKDDSAALQAMFTDQSIVLSNELKLTGTDSIMKGWVHQNMPVLLNLTTTTLSSGASDSVAFSSGTWRGQIMAPEDSVFSEGVYTLIWKKQADNNWKVALAHL